MRFCHANFIIQFYYSDLIEQNSLVKPYTQVRLMDQSKEEILSKNVAKKLIEDDRSIEQIVRQRLSRWQAAKINQSSRIWSYTQQGYRNQLIKQTATTT